MPRHICLSFQCFLCVCLFSLHFSNFLRDNFKCIVCFQCILFILKPAQLNSVFKTCQSLTIYLSSNFLCFKDFSCTNYWPVWGWAFSMNQTKPKQLYVHRFLWLCFFAEAQSYLFTFSKFSILEMFIFVGFSCLNMLGRQLMGFKLYLWVRYLKSENPSIWFESYKVWWPY